jgi:hypothetical protein
MAAFANPYSGQTPSSSLCKLALASIRNSSRRHRGSPNQQHRNRDNFQYSSENVPHTHASASLLQILPWKTRGAAPFSLPTALPHCSSGPATARPLSASQHLLHRSWLLSRVQLSLKVLDQEQSIAAAPVWDALAQQYFCGPQLDLVRLISPEAHL